MLATTKGPDERGRFTPVIDLGQGFGRISSARKFNTEDEAHKFAVEAAAIVKSEFIRRGWRNSL